jgi:hypothetical protein
MGERPYFLPGMSGNYHKRVSSGTRRRNKHGLSLLGALLVTGLSQVWEVCIQKGAQARELLKKGSPHKKCCQLNRKNVKHTFAMNSPSWICKSYEQSVAS